MQQQEAAAGLQAGIAINNTSWTLIGPQPTTGAVFGGTTSGRVTAIAVDTTDATGNTLYIGGAEGGVWRTTNGGTSWTPLTDTQFSLAIGSLAVDPNNHLNIYAGTGEENFNLDGYYGGGLLKSTNGGTSWAQVGASTFGGPLASEFGGSYIGSIAVQPGVASGTPVLLVASQFSSGPNFNSGIWRSTDGGNTWAFVLPTTSDEGSDGTSLFFVSNTTAYAAIGGFGDSNNGVYKSTNAGLTWTAANGSGATALITGTNAGRITLVAAPSSATTLYASIADPSTSGLAGMFKSTDGGTTWNPITTPLGTGGTTDFCGTQCWYDMPMAVNTTNASQLYVGGSYNYSIDSGGIYMSTDGGTTWSSVNSTALGLHPDFHAIAFAPGPKLYTGNDGGMWSTTNLGSTSPTWTDLNSTLAITQPYPGMSISLGSANVALVGTQDNDTEIFSGSLSWKGSTACGDGAWTAIDPTNSNTMWTACAPGSSSALVHKSTDGGNTWSNAATGISTSDPVAFIPPLVMDLKNPSTLYYGTNHVYQTTNGGTAWASISPDLTNGGGDLTAIAVSPVSSTFLFAGTSNALVWYTTNTGGAWTQIPSGLPPRYPAMVQGDPQTSTTFYVTFSGFSGFGDALGHVFKCTTTTSSCSDISSNLPNTPVNDIAIDPANPNTFYVGTDTGVYMTTNAGGSWSTFSNGLPNVVVLDVKLHAASRTLRAATHGRSVWDFSLSSTLTQQTLTVSVTGTGAGAVTSNPAGVDCPSTCAPGFTTGTMVSLTPTPAVGSAFGGWSGSCSGTGACVVTMSGTGTPAVTATFTAAATDTLTVNKTGTGTGTVTSTSPDTQINCGSTCSGNYASGTSVTLSAQAAGGSTFTSWSSACTPTTSTPCTVTVNSNPTTVTATFTASGSGAPVLTVLSPSSVVAGGSTPVPLTVTGANFVSGATVLWNGSMLTTTFNSSTQLQASIPITDFATAGIASVTVTNPAGGGTSNPLTFDVLETFTGATGYVSMFVNGADLGNSVLFQSNGLIGLNTTTPQATLDVQLTTGSTNNAVNSTITLNNSTAISCCVLSAFKMTLNDVSTATNLSKQPARFVYLRDAAATGGVSAFDSIMTATSFLSANAPYQLRGVNIEGPTIGPGLTLGNFTGLYIGSGGGGGTVTSKYALVTEANAGNVGIGTITPATALQVFGDGRVGNSGTNGCLQNFSGAGLVGTCTSDARLKTNILPFAPVLNKLVLLQPVHFEWNPEANSPYRFGAGRNAGLLAQDVEKVFPEMVAVDAHGYKTVNYSELPYLT
ncbi:MAG: tail fiber domain-containing protein, partial [Terriglobales bacterium]